MENQFNATPEQLADIGYKALNWKQLDRERMALIGDPCKRASYLQASEKAEAARLALKAATDAVLGVGHVQ